jgi:hypothetical protein
VEKAKVKCLEENRITCLKLRMGNSDEVQEVVSFPAGQTMLVPAK